MTGPGVPAGGRRAGWANLGCSPAQGHRVHCDVGVCQGKAEANPTDRALELGVSGGRERSGPGRTVPVRLHPSGGTAGVRAVIEVSRALWIRG